MGNTFGSSFSSSCSSEDLGCAWASSDAFGCSGSSFFTSADWTSSLADSLLLTAGSTAACSAAGCAGWLAATGSAGALLCTGPEAVSDAFRDSTAGFSSRGTTGCGRWPSWWSATGIAAIIFSPKRHTITTANFIIVISAKERSILDTLVANITYCDINLNLIFSI